ncbi:MAG: hypothetical protein IJT79_02165 [Ruminococcus sp.]|nr:hypothetical protein [Ruminococcus sp.]
MDNHNNISYADGWKKAAEPIRREVARDITKAEEPVKKKNEKKGSKPLLTLIQICVCLLIVLAAYVLKTFGGDMYKDIKKIYETEINNEIILNPYENNLDKLFNASQD